LHIGSLTVSGVSIFEYPWQILVLGFLMAVLAVVPILISQLMSFSYSILFIVSAAVFANLGGLALTLLLSCAAVACRPLRFRSRFISVALCTAPQLVYWGFFGGAVGDEPIRWGFSLTPWIVAWLDLLFLAGLVLGIGHYTRYKPGLVWSIGLLNLVIAGGVFYTNIGFDELDYQLYIANNDPEKIEQFHDHKLTGMLDSIVTNPTAGVRRYLQSSFYPTEPIPLRAKIKEKIQANLEFDRWPMWMEVGDELRYQDKREELFEQYDHFIEQRVRSRRMPIALYYKAMLLEYTPDIQTFAKEEILRFYSDYPGERAQEVWYWLYQDFSDSMESIEARVRIVMHWISRGKFEQARKLLNEAKKMTEAGLQKIASSGDKDTDSIFSPFKPSSETVITEYRLVQIERRIQVLCGFLLCEKDKKEESLKTLSEFILLNPRSRDYIWKLDELFSKTDKKDSLYDNLLLAKARLIADDQLRGEKFKEIMEKYRDTDGGETAFYDLALLKIGAWRYCNSAETEMKKELLVQAKKVLFDFIEEYPASVLADQARKNLADLSTIK
jgi:hypothetical protein